MTILYFFVQLQRVLKKSFMRIFTKPCSIYNFDIDLASHVTNSTYIRWLDEMREQMLIECGLPLTEILKRGCLAILLRTEIHYKQGLFYGDDVVLQSGCKIISPVRMTFIHEFKRRKNGSTGYDEVVSTANQDAIFVKQGSHRPVKIFDEIIKSVE
jgi:YbgC/YbaW family acyl-CoA thioester hydrolase